jgi:hypothetical protein
MARRTRGDLHDRERGWSGDARAREDRLRIAQAAARLIVEHGLTDWSLAKRKAARQLTLAASATFPSDAEIEEALSAHHALFGGDAHAATLRAQRIEALAWMKRLAAWSPLLVGGVAAGWATEHSDLRLELVADDAKAVEIGLANAAIRYAALPPREGDTGAHLLIETPHIGVRIVIVTPQQRRNRPRRDDEPRLEAAAVEALLSPSA